MINAQYNSHLFSKTNHPINHIFTIPSLNLALQFPFTNRSDKPLEIHGDIHKAIGFYHAASKPQKKWCRICCVLSEKIRSDCLQLFLIAPKVPWDQLEFFEKCEDFKVPKNCSPFSQSLPTFSFVILLLYPKFCGFETLNERYAWFPAKHLWEKVLSLSRPATPIGASRLYLRWSSTPAVSSIIPTSSWIKISSVDPRLNRDFQPEPFVGVIRIKAFYRLTESG